MLDRRLGRLFLVQPVPEVATADTGAFLVELTQFIHHQIRHALSLEFA